MSKDILQRKRILTKASSGSSISTPISVANGGTGLTSYAIGDIIYASGTTTLAKLADVATGSVLVSGGVGVAPAWSSALTLTGAISAGAATSIGFTGRSIIKSPADGFFAFSNAAATAFADVVVGTVTTGNASSTNGSVIFKNSTNANTVTLVSGVTSSSYSLTLPTSSVTGSILMDIGGVLTESISYRAQQATPFSTAFGFESHSSGSFSGINNSSFGYQAGKAITSGTSNTFLGAYSGTAVTTGAGNIGIGGGLNGGTTPDNTIAIGTSACAAASPTRVIAIGTDAGRASSVSDCIFLGYGAGYNQVYNSCIIIAAGTNITTAANQGILGGTAAPINNWYFNGVTHTTPSSVNLRGSGGSGSNVVAANLNLYAGLSTGSGTPATIGFYSSAAGASSSTAQTAVKVLEITNSTTITTTDAVNYALGSTTGTKWGTATTQKLAFWGVTPVTQYATTGTTTGFTANASANTLFNESTFTGDTGATAYTISDLVKALKLCGIILA